MSIFRGKVDEIKEISIDMFLGADNIESTAYFLSHCHTDHMVGLNTVKFSEALMNRDNVYLYTSGISYCILKNDIKYQHLAGKIKPLSINRPNILIIPSLRSDAEPKEISVTLIPAGHCPGSVMFLFELSKENVLYTGDFRIPIGGAQRFPQFHHSDGTPKEINTCYLDATFFDELYPSFPSRKESLVEICSLIKEWLDINPAHEILLDRSAKYGYEHVYVGIKNMLGVKTHVEDDIFLKYRNVRKISSVVTVDSSETRVHACGPKTYGNYLPCRKTDVKVKTIRVSCWWYKKEYQMAGEIVGTLPQYTRVCYACHCSYSELIDFVKYLSPKKVVACAVPEDKTADEVEKEIFDLLKSVNRKRKGILANILDEDRISVGLKIQAKRKMLMNIPKTIRPLINVSQEMPNKELRSVSSPVKKMNESRQEMPFDVRPSVSGLQKNSQKNESNENSLDTSKSCQLEKKSGSRMETPLVHEPCEPSESKQTSQKNQSNGNSPDSAKSCILEKMSESRQEMLFDLGPSVSGLQKTSQKNESNGSSLDSSTSCQLEKRSESRLETPLVYIPCISDSKQTSQNNEPNGNLLGSSKSWHSMKIDESRLQIPLDPCTSVSESQKTPQKNESSGSLFDSDSELSPSLLPQYSVKIIDPTACQFSSECYLIHEGNNDKEIEIITLSSDESPEIFVME